MNIPNIPSEGFDKNKGLIHQSKSDIDKLKNQTEKVNKKDEPLKLTNFQGGTLETLHKTILLGDLSRANASNDKVIDIEGVYIVQFDSEGKIKLDENGNPMYSKLFVTGDSKKQNIVWDTVNHCWRFYAVYADLEE